MRFFALAALFAALPVFLFSQKTVSGKVTDISGEALPGAAIFSKANPAKGTVADAEGTFKFEISENDTLVVRFQGFAKQEIPAAGQTLFEVVLEEENSRLNEVVVTAFGIERQQRELGYSTQKIEGQDIVKSNSANLVAALSGKLAGVNVINTNGVEGGTTRFVIRGNNLITGDNQPLIIVDGVPLENRPGWTSVESGVDWGSAINNINMDDVERVDVLKGATAAALYGARGGNGVVLITMKKGKERSGLGVDYSFSARTVKPFYWREVQNEFGFGGPFSFDPPVLELDSNGVAQHPSQLYTDFGPGGKPTSESFGAYASSQSWGAPLDGRTIRWWDGEMRPWSPQPDNFKRFFNEGLNRRHNISFSGGGKSGTVRVSFTREDNESVALNSNFDQTTGFLGAKFDVSKRVRAEASFTYISYNRLNSPTLGSDNYSFGKIMVYGYPRSYQGENLVYENPDGTKRDFGSNPFLWGAIDVFWSVYNNNTRLKRNKVIGSAAVFFDVTDWLTLMLRGNTDNTFDESETKNKPHNLLGTLGGFYGHTLSKERVYNNEFLLTAIKNNILPRLKTSLSLGGSQYSYSYYGIWGSNGNEWVNGFLYSFSNFKGFPNGVGEAKSERRLNSLYSFLNLDYADWLYAQAALRNDYASTLPPEHSSYFFPSGNVSFLPMTALGWENRVVNYAKIRAAFAETATDDAPYQLERYYSTGSFAGQPTAGTEGVVRPLGLQPHRSRSFETGFEIGLWNDRVQVDFTAYYTKSFFQILDSPVPISSGYPTVRINTGQLSNRGIELVLHGWPLARKNFSWKTTLNLARNQNRLDQLADGAEIIELASLWGSNGPSVAVKAGEPYGIITGFDYVRDEQGRPFLNEAGTHYQLSPVKTPIKIYDENGQFKRYANSTPKLTGGLLNTFRFKTLSLAALVDFKWRGDLYAGSYATSVQSGQSPSTLPERQGEGLPFTSPDGQTRNIGVILDGVLPNGEPNTQVVHYYYKYLNQGGWGKVLTTPAVFENTWVKLREVSLSWSLPKKHLGKYFQKLDINLVGRDLLWLYSSLPDRINPEGANGSGNAQGVEFGALPGMRSFGLGLSVGF